MRFVTEPRRLIVLMGLALASAFAPVRALAHEIRPAIVTITITDKIEATMSLNLEALVAGIGPGHKDSSDAPEAQTYNALRQLPPEALRQAFEASSRTWLDGLALTIDGRRVPLSITEIVIPPVGDAGLARIATVRVAGPAPTDAKNLTWTYPAAYGSNILRVRLAGGDLIEGGWLKDGQTSAPLELNAGAGRRTLSLLAGYVQLGFTHIVPKGLDHILFVLGLYFLGTQLRPLLVQVTAFTLAHSVTLALGLYGLVEISPRIVEPLIALSIVYVAVENLMTTKLTPWRPLVVFVFGLLHGLGFAGILREAELAPANTLTALIGFNVGVELGQLAVILGAFLATGLWFRDKPWYRARIVWPACLLIALAGFGWTVERIWFT